MAPPSSLLRYAAISALLYSQSITAKSTRYGAVPTQTIGYGLPILEAMATEAPSAELVRRKLERRDLLNVCSEWAISGEDATPQCFHSQTCLFSSVGDTYYEGCGLTSVAYDWITECSDYPNSGDPSPSQTFCDSAFPACGTFKFVFRPGATFSNYACAESAYTYMVTLVETTGSVELAGSSSELSSRPRATVTVTSHPTNPFINSNSFPSQTITRPPSTRTAIPNPYRKKPAPIGAIVGGAIGGIAVLAVLSTLLWFCIRKRNDKNALKTTNQQQADAATAQAYHNSNATAMAEVDGTTASKPNMGAFAPVNANYIPPHEKPGPNVATNEYRPHPQAQYSNNSRVSDQSSPPPPVYAIPASNQHHQQQPYSPQSQSQVSSPSSQYTTLSPATPRTYNSTIPPSAIPISPAETSYTNTNMNQRQSTTNTVSELGVGSVNGDRLSYQAYHPSNTPIPTIPQNQEQQQQQGYQSYNPGNSADVGGNGAGTGSGGIVRRPVAGSAGQGRVGTDMNGVPLGEGFRVVEMP